MNYKKILKNIAEKEKISVKEVEKEMLAALRAAGYDLFGKRIFRKRRQRHQQQTIYSIIV